jgi:hypothetical protein
MRRVMLLAFSVMFTSSAVAKTVTVNYADLPFDTAKQILLSYNKNLIGVADDALKTVLQNSQTLTFDDGILPQDLRNKLEVAQKMSTVSTVLKAGTDYAEQGRAIGIATGAALSAITTETAKFAQTTPGIFLMVMVAWKIMGQDFLATTKGIIVGVPMLIFWCCTFIWWMRRVYGIRYVKSWTADGKPSHERLPPLSIQWNKDWAEAHNRNAKSDETAGYSIVALLKSAGFIAVIFATIWLVI